MSFKITLAPPKTTNLKGFSLVLFDCNEVEHLVTLLHYYPFLNSATNAEKFSSFCAANNSFSFYKSKTNDILLNCEFDCTNAEFNSDFFNGWNGYTITSRW